MGKGRISPSQSPRGTWQQHTGSQDPSQLLHQQVALYLGSWGFFKC